MKDCILAKKAFPDMIPGFDFAGQESAGKSLDTNSEHWPRPLSVQTPIFDADGVR